MGKKHTIKDLLLKKARADADLAARYGEQRELLTASLLYNRAIAKILKFLYIKKRKAEPPTDASIRYLLDKSGIPEYIKEGAISIDEEEDEISSLELREEQIELDMPEIEESEYLKVMAKREVAKKLMHYAKANK